MPHFPAVLLSLLVCVASSTALDFSPKTVIQRNFTTDGSSAILNYHFSKPALDLDAALLANVGNTTTVRCDSNDGTLRFTVPLTTPGSSSRSTPSAVTDSVSRNVQAVWYRGMGVQLQTLGSASSCSTLRLAKDDAQAFRVVTSYRVTQVASGAEVVMTTAPANQTEYLQRVVADLEIAVQGARPVGEKSSDTSFNVLNLNWNNAAHLAAAADSSISLYSGSTSAAGGALNGNIDISCSNCYFWIDGKVKVHVDTGVIGEKLLLDTAELYAYFEGTAEVMAEIAVKAQGTFSKTWSKTYGTAPLTYNVGGVLNINGQVGVLLEYSASLAAGSVNPGLVKVGQRYTLSWGVPIDILNGKGKMPAAYTKQVSTTTGSANFAVTYVGEARVIPQAKVGLDLVSLAGIDLTLGITGSLPHMVDAHVSAGGEVIFDPATGGTASGGYECAVAFTYGTTLIPFLRSSATLLGMQFSVFDYSWDLPVPDGQVGTQCLSKSATVTLPPLPSPTATKPKPSARA